MFDEGLDQFVRGVVRSGATAFVALLESKPYLSTAARCSPLAARSDKDRVEFEQSFVDGAEFFDVEGAVIDADELVRVRIAVEA